MRATAWVTPPCATLAPSVSEQQYRHRAAAEQIKGKAPLFEKDRLLLNSCRGLKARPDRLLSCSISPFLFQQSLESADYPEDGRYRYAHGDVGTAIRDIAKQLAEKTSGWLGRIEVLVDTLNEALGNKQYPVPLPDVELFYQQAGGWQSRAEQLLTWGSTAPGCNEEIRPVAAAGGQWWQCGYLGECQPDPGR